MSESKGAVLVDAASTNATSPEPGKNRWSGTRKSTPQRTLGTEL
ncbi:MULTISPECIES: hypothetical protein [Streptomyces]|nr:MULTISPECIES: hypothetical protein [Streptomyces]